MAFTSLSFYCCFGIFFLLYWTFFTKKNIQNYALLVASYSFYALWDWRFVFLLLISTVISYICGILIQNGFHRKTTNTINIIFNVGILIFFKYFNFFIDTFIKLFDLLNISLSFNTLQIILPLGISFYTFKSISYTIDIYREKICACRNFWMYATYISFFPQIVAGPIERIYNFLPQLFKQRIFNYDLATDGCRQILWGLFKKILIADNCAIAVNIIFSDIDDYKSSTLLLGGILYSFQIYCDFSGYSDIAIGITKLLGFNSIRNFNLPYFSRNIVEFWRKWHISLTTWFRDYVYIPLGGNRCSKYKVIRNTFIIFIISGLWHGANWTYFYWGVYHAVLYMPFIIFDKKNKYKDSIAKNHILPSFKELIQMLTLFFLTVFGWIIFRSESITEAINYIYNIFSLSLFTIPDRGIGDAKWCIVYIIVLLIVEWSQRNLEHPFYNSGNNILLSNKVIRNIIYITILLLILVYTPPKGEFIYAQF